MDELAFEAFDVSEQSEDVEEFCDAKLVVDEDITTDKRLEGRPKISTVSKR